MLCHGNSIVEKCCSVWVGYKHSQGAAKRAAPFVNAVLTDWRCAHLVIAEKRERNKKNIEALEYVKTMIDYDVEMMELDDIDWDHVGYVEVEETDHKCNLYPKNYKY